uniref:Zinc finger BED domain-containing protein 5-like n=1 Tax=Phallusia mammillata TaxID=59560 RepID=A0A6F9DWM9_9ASCI|nr:zinc finger BED domain-containing protein 5-like [Phallusia mammillata]
MIFTRLVDQNFTVYEELLKIQSLVGGTKGSDIYEALSSVVSEYGGFDKCSCVVTDGAKAMVGSRIGLVGLLKENGINCITLHCIIHQEALCGKVLKMMNVMQSVINMVNLIRGGNKVQRHRKFMSFLEELDAEFSDLPLYTSIRWLSAGKVLKHFFGLRKEILSFFEEQLSASTETFQAQLRSIKFLSGLAFLPDMTNHLNVLNLSLQGKGQSISHLMGHVEGFRSKLVLFTNGLQKNDLTHFTFCRVIKEEYPNADFTQFVNNMTSLSDEFRCRFADFQKLKSPLALFNNPMHVSINTQPSEMQLELCELQNDPFLLSKKMENPENFWKYVSKERYPILKDSAVKLHSMFGSTYICECAFSAMNDVKSKNRNKLGNNALYDCLRMATTSIAVDTQALAKEASRPQMSH